MNYVEPPNRLDSLMNYLNKEEKNAKLMLSGSIDSLIESGKIANRLSCVKYKERLKIIEELKSKLK